MTAWEIFSGGQNPYPSVDLMSLVQMLKSGRRLDASQSASCSPEMYVFTTMHAVVQINVWCMQLCCDGSMLV